MVSNWLGPGQMLGRANSVHLLLPSGRRRCLRVCAWENAGNSEISDDDDDGCRRHRQRHGRLGCRVVYRAKLPQWRVQSGMFYVCRKVRESRQGFPWNFTALESPGQSFCLLRVMKNYTMWFWKILIYTVPFYKDGNGREKKGSW